MDGAWSYSGKVSDVLDLVARLRAAKISFAFAVNRDDALMVKVHVPGERWEVEFMREGTVEVEVFRSAGEIGDKTTLRGLFDRFSD